MQECGGSEIARNGGKDILLLPDTVLTKICIVSSLSELSELMLEMLDVRRIMLSAVMWNCCCVADRARKVVSGVRLMTLVERRTG